MFKVRAADRYFSYIAKHYPVMCASGAFGLMPPVGDATNWLDRYDDFSPKGIEKHVAKLKKYRGEFETQEIKGGSVQDRATARALALSASCAIVELESIRTWERCPAHYLHVAFTGLEQALVMPSKNDRVREKRFTKRIKAIPSLLSMAESNIEAITAKDRGLAQTMIRDCARYLTQLGDSDIGKVGKVPRFLADCFAALRDFDRFVSHRTEIPEKEGPPFEEMLRTVLGTDKTPQEIYSIAEREYTRRLEAIHSLEAELGKPWKTALDEYEGHAKDDEGALDAIIREIHRLRSFVFESPLAPILNDSPLRINPQPLHLASTLRPIHYDPALQSDEASRCYVSPQIFTGRGFRDDPSRLKRMRREFTFMAARQSYPGRHLLDTQRRTLANTPMAQVANPLFMAGWLSFSEDLLDEMGYLETPMDKLVHHKRGLARAAQAMIDAGLAVGNLDQERCLTILMDAGYSKEECLERVRKIRLEPASRVMPVLGLHEINSLRRAADMPLPKFCSTILSYGQISFTHLGEIVRGMSN